jgi:hypothetical protein
VVSTDTDGSSKQRRHIPVVTVMCLGIALGLLILMSIVRLPGAGGLYFCLPPALALLGCVAALLDRRLASDDKRTWAIGSALAGFAGVIALLVIATLVEAIDWTINGPPF